VKCLKISWLHFAQGKSCWIWLKLYTWFVNLHVEVEHFG
jgi:hypothetical protein